MHAITVVLFFIPMSVLGIAWRGLALKLPKPCATVATITTLTAMGFWLSWTHRPHGLMPARGLWLPLATWNALKYSRLSIY
jgi:hypothetical protein